MIKIKEFC